MTGQKSLINRKFVFYFYWINILIISFGISIDFASPNIEIHLPFGFIKIGWEKHTETEFYTHDYFRGFGIR